MRRLLTDTEIGKQAIQHFLDTDPPHHLPQSPRSHAEVFSNEFRRRSRTTDDQPVEMIVTTGQGIAMTFSGNKGVAPSKGKRSLVPDHVEETANSLTREGGYLECTFDQATSVGQIGFRPYLQGARYRLFLESAAPIS